MQRYGIYMQQLPFYFGSLEKKNRIHKKRVIVV